MSQKEIALDVAAFLDSEQAKALRDPARDSLRKIAETLLTACYKDLGKKPRYLDGEDVTALLTRVLPGYFRTGDASVKHVPAVFEAYLDHLDASEVVPHAYEIRVGFEASAGAFMAAVKGGNEPARTLKQQTVEHRAAKLGRNDPCFCGSGKKFKKCHGKSS
jgi:hypothetical protein